MKYAFSNFTGRLSAPSPLETPTKFVQYAEAPTIQYPVGTTFSKEIAARPGGGKYGEVPLAMQNKIKQFQLKANLPVHLKGGPADMVLLGASGILCVVGLYQIAMVMWELSWPRKKE